jgi:methylmalonyl-CoA/ethylmalonyl-CoA epimerase
MHSLKFKHIGVAVPDIVQAVDAYRAIFGYRVLSGPFDDPIQNVSVCFLAAGPSDDLVMELVAPLNEQSPVSKLLVNRLGAYHVCYEVDDLASALSRVCHP